MRHPSDDGTEIVEDGAEERFAKVGGWPFVSSWCRGCLYRILHVGARSQPHAPSRRGDVHTYAHSTTCTSGYNHPPVSITHRHCPR